MSRMKRKFRECSMSFSEKESLDVHRASHNMEPLFRCNKCDEDFLTYVDYTIHRIRQDHSVKSLRQRNESCNYRVSTLNRHMKIHRNYACSYCERVFRTHYTAKCHERVHMGQKLNPREPVWDEKQTRRSEQVTEEEQTGRTNCEDNDECGLATEAFKDQEEVAPNKRRKKAQRREIHKECHERKKCNEFKERENYKRSSETEKIHESDERDGQKKDQERGEQKHYRREKPKQSDKRKIPETVQQKPTETHVIEVCDRVESQVNSLDKPYCCPTCDKQYPTMLSLKRHKKIHMEEKTFKCGECARSFNDKRTLYVHRVSHNTKPLFQCNKCDEYFITYFDYAIHRRNGRCSISRCQCDVCGKYLSTIGTLNKHMKIHWNEKDHGCRHCEKMFRTRQHAQVHERVHTGQKPYACENCGKRFAKESNLTSHMATHTSEKNFECPMCKEKFKSSLNLTAHVGREHLPGAKE